MWREQPSSPLLPALPSQPQCLPSAAMQQHSAVQSPLGTEGKISGQEHTELLVKDQ